MGDKLKIHFHADNTFWSGAEQMLVCLFSSKSMGNTFDMSFSYRDSISFDRLMFEWFHVAETPDRPWYEWLLRLRPIDMRSRKWKYLSFLSDAYRIYRILKRIQPNVLHVHNGGYPGALSCSAAVFAARWLKKRPKIVYFINNTPKKRSFVQRVIERPIDNLLSKDVDVFLSGSQAVSYELAKVFGDANYGSIPNTIHHHPLEDRDRVRADLKIPPGSVVIGSIGLFEERKGYIYLIEAFKRLWTEFGKIHLLLVGDGSLKHLYHVMLSHTTVPLWKGYTFRDDVMRAYSYINACDIYVQSSIEHEDFPISILQAMSLKKAIVGTNVGGIFEQIGDGGGEVITPRSVDYLAGCLRGLLNDKGRRMRLGIKAKQRFDEQFSYDVIMERYVGFYRSILDVR